MTAQLCRGRPADWWETGDPGNALAVLICGLCAGCPDNDLEPHGVIRRGIAYSDAGKPLPPCSNCAMPNTAFTGGDASRKRCTSCADPTIAIPDVRLSRQRWVGALARRGFTTEQIAAEAGVGVRAVERIRAAENAGRARTPRVRRRAEVAA